MDGRMPFKLPHALQKKAKKLNFGSVTFCVVVYDDTHYYGWFCMVKGMPRSRSVGVQQKLKLELSKVPAPVVKLD